MRPGESFLRYCSGRRISAGAALVLPALLLLLPAGCGKKAEMPATRVTGIEIEKRITLGQGISFGGAGAYETVAGRVHYTLDPDDPANEAVTDARFAAGGDGLVHYSADVVIVKPVDISRGNGALLYHVVNRGNFDTRVLDPEGWARVASAPSGSGERMGRLMKQGFTVVFSGWQDDLPDDGRLRLHAPEARQDNRPMPGEALSEIEVGSDSVTTAYLGAEGHRAYAVDPVHAPEAEMRIHRTHADPGTVVPRDKWYFALPDSAGEPVPDSTHVYYPEGFRRHLIYTVRYRPNRSPVMGLCFPAVRDLLSFLTGSDTLNPLLGPEGECPVEHRIAYGSSQCGRFLRNFLYDGFNATVDGGKLLHGVFANVPGCRRGFFNYRFAQPSRAWGFYPEFIFPFTDLEQTDPVTGSSGGILENTPDSLRPKIFYVHHSGEYWSSGAGLTHASPDATEDAELPENVRIYAFSGTAHGNAPLEGGRPEPSPGYLLPFNPNASHFLEVPLLEAFCRWVMFDEQPPQSAYPRLDRQELVPVEEYSYPVVPDVEMPVLVEVHPRFDFGPRLDEGILDKAMPGLGVLYPVMVPAVDDDGNELGGLRSPHVAVPLASYTGWNYPDDFVSAAETKTVRLSGAWLPFCADRSERRARGDSRPSLAERYSGRGDYLDRLRKAAEELVSRGLMFQEDIGPVLEQGGAMYDYVAANGAWKKSDGFNMAEEGN